ncbi:hypothetical protein AMQ84_05360 [Paenibacillus riograndensis]|uniref:Uncharacterized protein n=1 Tax=Paenibacillus riograndensis TaxID=483937 RepID=A0A132U912_9BACL|nr:hypothetical protein AMQ84_05360 [Paenibacillus riograndensis]
MLGVYPLLRALRYMFYNYQGYGEPVYIGLDNFSRLMRDHEFWNSVLNTGIYAAGKRGVNLLQHPYIN